MVKRYSGLKLKFNNYTDVGYKPILCTESKRRRVGALPTAIGKLYKSELPISYTKKQDLLKLCQSGVIPEEFHGWYSSLPSTNKKIDRNPEQAVGF